MDSEEYRRKIEEDILRLIEKKLIARQIDANRARQIAQLVLNTLHPQMTLNQIYDAVQKLDDNFPELASVVLSVNNDYDEKVKQVANEYAQKLIARGKIDEALSTVKEAIDKKIRLPDI